MISTALTSSSSRTVNSKDTFNPPRKAVMVELPGPTGVILLPSKLRTEGSEMLKMVALFSVTSLVELSERTAVSVTSASW